MARRPLTSHDANQSKEGRRGSARSQPGRQKQSRRAAAPAVDVMLLQQQGSGVGVSSAVVEWRQGARVTSTRIC